MSIRRCLLCLALLLTLPLAGCAPGFLMAEAVPTPEPTRTPRPTLPPLPTMTPTATATLKPTATRTPVPTDTPPPTATPLPTPYGGGRPATLSIPAIGVKDAHVVDVGIEANGAMETPKGWWDIGWYKLGPIPGQVGNSVLSGHYDSDRAPAVFWNLHRLKKGDRIYVGMEDGSVRTFLVEVGEVYPFNNAPMQRIFGPSDRPRLNLITCNGSFDPRSQNYNRRLVVYAVMEIEG